MRLDLRQRTLMAPFGSRVIDHFLCYRTRGARLKRSGFHIVDQFGSWTYDLLRVARLCTAVDKRGEGVIARTRTYSATSCVRRRAYRRSTARSRSSSTINSDRTS